jgi:hypothetical protein
MSDLFPDEPETSNIATALRRVSSLDQAEKLLPQPQDFTAFGFLNVNPRRDKSV